MYVPRQWRIAFPIVFAVLVLLTIGLVLALREASVWLAAACGGTICGLLLSIGWAMHLFLPKLSAFLLVPGVALATGLWLFNRQAGAYGLAAAAALVIAWFLIYDVAFTGRVNSEVVKPLVTLGGDGRAGRALIVYHSSHGGFQSLIQHAFADGLQSQGWEVEMTTASKATPADLSRYGLLILGVPSYNWKPARPILDYLNRLGDLGGKPVALVVSGGGMTERCMRVLRRRVAEAHGQVVQATEVWTSRSNVELHDLSDPQEIMRQAGARLKTVTSG
jgi:NAD(P)H-dependent FMN reductase